MKNDNIFIHIPKTGGTTINCAMNGTDWQTKPDFNYRHILYETKRSNSKDIFNENNYAKYRDYKIFTMIRDPADRLLSEYYFIRDRQEFMANFKKKPKNFKDYINNRQTQNYMVGFMLGKKMFDTNFVDQSDYDLVIRAIDQLPIYVGLFEEFSASMAYYEKYIGIKWPKKIEAKRMTLNRPKKEEIDEETKALIYKNNTFDVQLYNHCKDIFQKNQGDKLKQKVTFEKDQYNYVVKYTQRFPLIELYLKNKNFLKYQSEYFRNLAMHLQQDLNITDGRSLVASWNLSFINALSKQLKDETVSNSLLTLKDSQEEPLEVTKKIAKLLDDYLPTKGKHLMHKALLLRTEDVVEINIASKKQESSGLFSKFKNLFSK